ncbi:MAG: cupin domain-containing protein [Bacteroidia bacterium]|nr:cupin domain-containing protein [Bacteroidia bacterium]
MKTVAEFIESGVLELYVLGIATAEEFKAVEAMAAQHEEIRNEIEQISESLEMYAAANVEMPNPTIKPLLLASIDYAERLKNGEKQTFPAELNQNSTVADYAEWISRKDMVLPDDFKEFCAKIIGYTTKMTTAIIWIKEMAPHEVHDNEFEKFLILEGACDIIIDEKVHHMKPGDYMAIPLHSIHLVKVTSEIPCKAILQRVAA